MFSGGSRCRSGQIITDRYFVVRLQNEFSFLWMNNFVRLSLPLLDRQTQSKSDLNSQPLLSALSPLESDVWQMNAMQAIL